MLTARSPEPLAKWNQNSCLSSLSVIGARFLGFHRLGLNVYGALPFTIAVAVAAECRTVGFKHFADPLLLGLNLRREFANFRRGN